MKPSLSFCQYVHNGECVPVGYRIAWFEPWACRGVAFPAGLHLVAWLIHEVWTWTYWVPPSRIEKHDQALRSQWRAMCQGTLNEAAKRSSVARTALYLACMKIQSLQREARVQKGQAAGAWYASFLKQAAPAVTMFGEPDELSRLVLDTDAKLSA